MARHLIVCGHGAGDPGAIGSGTNERDWTRNVLKPHIEKYARQLKSNSIEFYDVSKNMFYESQAGRGAYTAGAGCASVTEFHLDGGTATSTGGHVIISTAHTANTADHAIANIIKKYVGWWGSAVPGNGVVRRNNLLNLNAFTNRGIRYRLPELGFVSNPSNMAKLNSNIDAIAKELVEAITGENLGTTPAPAPEETKVVKSREDLPMEFLYSAPGGYVAYVNGQEHRKFTSGGELSTFKAIKDQVSESIGDYVTDKNGNIVKDKNGNPTPQPFPHFDWTKNPGTVTVVERIYKEVK